MDAGSSPVILLRQLISANPEFPFYELHNLVSEEPERAARMGSQLMGWLDVQIAGVGGKPATPVRIQQISDRNMKRLRALGYIK